MAFKRKVGTGSMGWNCLGYYNNMATNRTKGRAAMPVITVTLIEGYDAATHMRQGNRRSVAERWLLSIERATPDHESAAKDQT